ncbi:hypothetical protein [Microscilla marina]|uniref:Uncharacterized protein n=1 Tax=Microscilla marina ATCC 23134 TaxID=313606 RepID=A1ZFC0_MICM2|nr:hypothetical protein [Microscilla marina]EAY30694.1 hypothetical protein M23134_01018 [Microscilla marina ATCC 23134]
MEPLTLQEQQANRLWKTYQPNNEEEFWRQYEPLLDKTQNLVDYGIKKVFCPTLVYLKRIAFALVAWGTLAFVLSTKPWEKTLAPPPRNVREIDSLVVFVIFFLFLMVSPVIMLRDLHTWRLTQSELIVVRLGARKQRFRLRDIRLVEVISSDQIVLHAQNKQLQFSYHLSTSEHWRFLYTLRQLRVPTQCENTVHRINYKSQK